MTKTRSTKKALLLSAFSLLICFSMLIGTTFAWFTDSVTSANNIIKSGNLDIELEYWNGTDWVDVEGKSDILTNTLWEPGVTEVAYLRLNNAGSLALKYQMGINIVSETAGKNVKNETFKLSDYIQFGVVENVNGETNKYATREAAVAAVEALEDDDLGVAKKISAGYTKSASMTAGQELYLALVVYMPTTVGNEANHNGTNIPQIDLGINVVATQMALEMDSFDNQYDKNATFPKVISNSTTVVSNQPTTITIEDVDSFMDMATATVPADAVLEDDATALTLVITVLENAHGGITFEGTQGFNAYDIEVIGLDESASNSVAITLQLKAGLTGLKLYHYDEEITAFNYDAATGILTFDATDFSPYTIVYDVSWDGSIDTTWYNDTDTTFVLTNPAQLAGLSKLVDEGNTFAGKTIELGVDMDLKCATEDGELVLFEPIGDASNADFSGTFDGKGHTIYNLRQDCNSKHVALFGAVYEGTVKNLTLDGAMIENDGSGYAGGIAAYAGASSFENITLRNTTVVNYNHNTGGIVAWCSNNGTTTTFDGINIESTTTIGSWWGSYDTRVGGVVGAMNTGNNVVIKNSTIACKLDVYNDVTSNYQWYNYRTAGMVVADVRDTETVDGRTQAVPSRVTCENVTVIFGDWANYHYCESASYGTPSYAEMGEYKFRRVEAGLGYGGVDLSACNHAADETHNELIAFTFLFGARDGKGIYGISEFNGVTVINSANQ